MLTSAPQLLKMSQPTVGRTHQLFSADKSIEIINAFLPRQKRNDRDLLEAWSPTWINLGT